MPIQRQPLEPIGFPSNIQIGYNSHDFINTRNKQQPLEPIGFSVNVQLRNKSLNYINNQHHEQLVIQTLEFVKQQTFII